MNEKRRKCAQGHKNEINAKRRKCAREMKDESNAEEHKKEKCKT